jgi:hypothetical protein
LHTSLWKSKWKRIKDHENRLQRRHTVDISVYIADSWETEPEKEIVLNRWGLARHRDDQ